VPGPVDQPPRWGVVFPLSVGAMKEGPSAPARDPDPTIWITRHARSRHDRSARPMTPIGAPTVGRRVGSTRGRFRLEADIGPSGGGRTVLPASCPRPRPRRAGCRGRRPSSRGRSIARPAPTAGHSGRPDLPRWRP